MTARTLPGIGLTGDIAQGAPWKVAGDRNWLLSSVLTQLAVESATTALPASPLDGVIYIVPTSAIPANQIAARDNGAWAYFAPFKGLTAYVRDTNTLMNFDGTAWVSSLASLAAPTGASHIGVRDTNVAAFIDTIVVNAPADYTGRPTTAGTGTDARAAVQAAIDAAHSVIDVGAGYYNYYSRIQKVIKLVGNYVFTAPATGPSLEIKDGIMLDLTEANVYFDYPATARYDWCAVKVGQYSAVRMGGVFSPSRRNSAPTGEMVYDAIRIVFTDLASAVECYSGAELGGWTAGAAIRTIGAFISWVKGVLRISNCSYGIVASNWGTAWQSVYPLPEGNPTGPSRRVNTDLFLDDITIVNIRNGGLVGATKGTLGNVYALDFDDTGLTICGNSLVFENIGYYAMNLGNVLNVGLIHLNIEECGNGDGMVSFNTIRTVAIENMRVNFAGREVPAPGTGTVTPNPSTVFKIQNVQCMSLLAFYLHNTYRADMTLASAEASVGYLVGGIFSDGYTPPPGPMFNGGRGSFSTKGTWNSGHFLVGNSHLWHDANGNLRRLSAAPGSDAGGDNLTDAPWRISIDPFLVPSAQTNWAAAPVINAAAIENGVTQSSGAANDLIAWDVVLGAGTWSLGIMHVSGPSRGIYTVLLDGAAVGTIDGYTVGALYNQVGSVAGINVLTGGKHRIALQMLTKNAASSGNLGSIQKVALQRTS